MRLFPASVLLLLLCSLAFAQTEKLPEILKPDAASEAEAQRMGAKIFKLLPDKMFYEWPEPKSLRDEDYKIGIRGGGSYYSFPTGSHSYNKWPEIHLLDIRLGAEGNLGFFADLGKRDLSTINLTSPETEYLLSYKLPKYSKELAAERTKFHKGVEGLLTLRSLVRPSQEDSYLLRVITLEKTDITVALQVLKIGPDGALTIAWKKLAELPTPFVLYMPDEELRAQIEAVKAKENIACGDFVVKDNILTFVGPWNDNNTKLENALKHNGIRYRGYKPDVY